VAGGLLALDLATRLGWAYAPIPAEPLPTDLEVAGRPTPQPLGGMWRIGDPGCRVGRFLSLYGDWLWTKLEELKPAGLIYEAPILPDVPNHGTAVKLMGLTAITEMVTHRRRMAWVRSAQPSSVKLSFTGSGKAGKDQMVAACRARGWEPEDDNHADAMALWCHGVGLVHTDRAKRRAA
jgi:crossover junction endodeoxyribonuclease RuvC